MNSIVQLSIIAAILSLAQHSSAQSHLDFAYSLDAQVYHVDGTLYFRAHSFPVFQTHNSVELKQTINEHVYQSFDHQPLPENAELVTDLTGLSIDDLIDPKQMVDMLKARIGLMGFPLKDTTHHIDIIYDIIRFPDNTQPLFNLQSEHHLFGNALAHPVHLESFAAYNWKSAEVLRLGHFGDDKLVKCVIKAIVNADYQNYTCGDQKVKDMWSEEINCNTEIGEWRDDNLHFSVDTRDLNCPESKSETWHVDVPNSCFEPDNSCLDK